MNAPDPAPSVVSQLDALLRARLDERPEGSYSVKVLTDATFVQRKIMEEAFEFCLEIQGDTPDPVRTSDAAADLVFHLMAALVGAGLGWADVEAALGKRLGVPARDSDYGPDS